VSEKWDCCKEYLRSGDCWRECLRSGYCWREWLISWDCWKEAWLRRRGLGERSEMCCMEWLKGCEVIGVISEWIADGKVYCSEAKTMLHCKKKITRFLDLF